MDQRERMFKETVHYLRHIKRHGEPESFEGKEERLESCVSYLNELTSAKNRLEHPLHAEDTHNVRIVKMALTPLYSGANHGIHLQK
jgi:hypothetical protein